MNRSLSAKAFILMLSFCMLLSSLGLVKPAEAAEEISESVLTLENPGFELPLTDGAAPGWTQILGVGMNGGISVTDAVYNSGSYSLKITDNDKVNFGVESSKIDVTPLTEYTTGAYVHIESGSVQLQMRFYKQDGSLIPGAEGGITVHDPNFTSTPVGQWQQLTVKAAAPAEAVSASVVLVSGKNASGISYWDDISVEKGGAVTPNPDPDPEPEPNPGEQPGPGFFLKNGGFEQPSTEPTIPGWTVKGGHARLSQSLVFEGQNSLYLENQANVGPAVHVESDLMNVKEGESYTLTSSVFLQNGQLEGFYVYVYDESGKLVPGPTGSNFHLYVNALPVLADGKWGLAEGMFKVQPGGKTARISVITGSKKSFQVYIDDVSLLKSVQNGGFEEDVTNGIVPGWKKFNEATDSGSYSVTDEKSSSGNKSLKIQNTPDVYLNVISDLIPVEPGVTYTAKARNFIEYGSADMYVRYFDSSRKYLGKQHYSIKSEPTSVWFTNEVEAIVPAEASYAAVMFAGSPKKSYTYYVDDVKFIKGNHIEKEVPSPDNSISKVGQNLGVQIRKATIMRGDIGKYADGRDVIYTVVQGAPSVFTVIDIRTEKVLKSMPLENTEGAWSVKVSTDGTVYLGAYNKGLLYRYLPDTDEMINLGYPLPTKDAVLYPMDSGKDGKMYGGNYPSGSVYEYEPATNKFTDFGTMAFKTQGERWTRVTVYDPEHHKIYAGVGNEARLVEYDIATGVKRDLLPEKYKDIISVYDLDLVGGKLFARKEANNSFETFVLDAESGEQIQITNGDTGEKGFELINYSRGVSPKSPIANKLYYAGLNGMLYEYDLSTDTYRSLGASIEGAAIGYGYVELEEEGFPGYSLVGLSGNGGKMFKYNLETGKVKLTDVMLPAEPVKIHDIERGPDGKIYTTGYLAGNVGVYTPTTGDSMYLNGLSQSEGTTVIHNKMYFGIYPDAKIYEYDLSKPWNRDNSDKLNPNLLFTLSKNEQIPGYTLQDRPFGMAGSEELNKLFVGTVPKNSLLGGVLAVYDLTERKAPEVYWNLVPDQSVLSLVYKDGIVYGGSSVYGGQGGTPAASEAVLFMWDVQKKEKVFEVVPVPGKKSITALHIGPDGNIWGLSNGALFVFDPEQRKVIYSKDEFPAAAGRWIDGSMETGSDGNVYATVGGNFFKVNADTKEMTVLATEVQKVAQDDFGHFYMYTADGTILYKYSIPELILKVTGAELSASDTSVKVGEESQLSLRAQLEKGRSTKELSGAKISYTISDPAAVSIKQGMITALKPGVVSIQATVSLNGTVVESNSVQLTITGTGSGGDGGENGGGNGEGTPGSPSPGNPPAETGTPSKDSETSAQGATHARIQVNAASVKLQNGAAALEIKDDVYKKAAEQAAAAGIHELVIQLPTVQGLNKWNVQLPVTALETAKNNKVTKVRLTSEIADMAVKLDAINNVAGSVLQLELSRIQGEGSNLSHLKGVPIYEFNVYQNNKKVTDFTHKRALEIVIPFELAADEAPDMMIMYLLDPDGKLKPVKSSAYDAVKKRVYMVSHQPGRYVIKQAQVNFNDVEENRWSQKYIHQLAARGILEGRTKNQFAPGEHVTRAEYLKLMMEAFDLIQGQSKADFVDVKEGAWYYQAVASAQNLGIASGVGGNRFEPHQQITREEMAVIASRIADTSGIELLVKAEQDDIHFSDGADIRPYAKQAVERLHKAGIITGMEGGRFNPQGMATREQAAKVVWLMLEATMESL